MTWKSFKLHINIGKCHNLEKQTVHKDALPKTVSSLHKICSCDINANMRFLEQNVKPFLKFTVEKVSVIVDYHTEQWRANRYFKQFIILKKINFEINFTQYKKAYIQGSCLEKCLLLWTRNLIRSKMQSLF